MRGPADGFGGGGGNSRCPTRHADLRDGPWSRLLGTSGPPQTRPPWLFFDWQCLTRRAIVDGGHIPRPACGVPHPDEHLPMVVRQANFRTAQNHSMLCMSMNYAAESTGGMSLVAAHIHTGKACVRTSPSAPVYAGDRATLASEAARGEECCNARASPALPGPGISHWSGRSRRRFLRAFRENEAAVHWDACNPSISRVLVGRWGAASDRGYPREGMGAVQSGGSEVRRSKATLGAWRLRRSLRLGPHDPAAPCPPRGHAQLGQDFDGGASDPASKLFEVTH
jgi:hypothetical protein